MIEILVMFVESLALAHADDLSLGQSYSIVSSLESMISAGFLKTPCVCHKMDAINLF